MTDLLAQKQRPPCSQLKSTAPQTPKQTDGCRTRCLERFQKERGWSYGKAWVMRSRDSGLIKPGRSTPRGNSKVKMLSFRGRYPVRVLDLWEWFQNPVIPKWWNNFCKKSVLQRQRKNLSWRFVIMRRWGFVTRCQKHEWVQRGRRKSKRI
jgi:hypothetical protein